MWCELKAEINKSYILNRSGQFLHPTPPGCRVWLFLWDKFYLMNKKQVLTQEELKEIVSYDESTGIFTWKERKCPTEFNTKFANKKAGCVCPVYGYVKIQIKGNQYKAHRLAWLYVYGEFVKMIDHKDNIRHHNWIDNLRNCTYSQNQQNKIKCEKRNKSKLLGVTFLKRDNRYKAQIGLNKKTIYLGSFETSIEAHNIYIEAKRQIHEFGML